MQNDRDVSMKGHWVSGTIHLGDQGDQKICTGTHRFETSRHPTPLTLGPVSGVNMAGNVRLWAANVEMSFSLGYM